MSQCDKLKGLGYDLHSLPIELARRIIGPAFDAEYYTTRYPDLSHRDDDAFRHYYQFGWHEGRDPSCYFSTSGYLRANPDVAELRFNPLLHYVVYGRDEGRKASAPPPQRSAPAPTRIVPLRPASNGTAENERNIVKDEIAVLQDHFDPIFYAERYPDMRRPDVFALEHYCVFGWKELRDPCASFSTKVYLQANKDVATSGVNPFYHYILYGRSEGRIAAPSDLSLPRKLKVDPGAILVPDPALRDLIRFPPRQLRPNRQKYDPAHLSIDWVIPDFSVGSGGHMTLFRLIRWLEIFGHTCRIWLSDHALHDDISEVYDDILRNFQTVRAQVRLADDGLERASGDVLIATGWQTVARVMNATGYRERYYLVQDFEPGFYASGSHALSAVWTYTQELACICASPWLSDTLAQNFGRWTRHFALAYDPEPYHQEKSVSSTFKKDADAQIAIYARVTTPRRCVELVLLALEHLATLGVTFVAHLFGAAFDLPAAKFECVVHGILDAHALGELYREADVGICLSSTNYSLVPVEMMACGLPVLEIDAPSTRAVFPDGVATRAGGHPLQIAAALQELLESADRRACQVAAATRWIDGLSWESSSRSVEQAILDRLAEGRHAALANKATRLSSKEVPYVSICLPTLNGGCLLHTVVRRIDQQRCPWPFEIIIMDSSSDDGSICRLPDTRKLTVETIRRLDFQHGRTRNQLAAMARGELVVFLTQDACPTDEFWLYNLVVTLEHYPCAAGAFGRHKAWPGASPFVKRDIQNHFARFDQYPLALSRYTDTERWASREQTWRQLLHFYSDNASCLRKSVWEKYPFPEINFGEDQAWCNLIIEAGLQRVYAPGAVVYHSHEFGAEDMQKRAEVEAQFFRRQFGYIMFDLRRAFDEQLGIRNAEDERWGRAQGVTADQMNNRRRLNEAWLSGTFTGSH